MTIEKRVNEEYTFWVKTQDGTAKAPEDYTAKNELITMRANEKERIIKIGIVDSEDWEPDEDFFVTLCHEETSERLAGENTQCKVTILDDDNPGQLVFEKREVEVKRNQEKVKVKILRQDGSDGDITVKIMTDNKEQFLAGDRKAIPYEDFVAIPETVLEFAHQEVEKEIEITLLQKDADEKQGETKEGDEEEDHSVKFYLKIFDAKPEGVKVSMKNICLIEIVPDSKDSDLEREKQAKTIIDMVLSNRNPTWGQQFKNAIILGPTIDEDDMIDDVTCCEGFTHLLTMPWKLLFAVIPPKNYCGGWAAFGVALTLIGMITAIVGELATLLGCVLYLKVSVTAITFVAMGTSLPDTFAS